ncbi:MAG: hypothetical protein IMF09_04145 [Proteobacteria bacterium]|nr:hypothetical protein [Pseudomonadota bacterium]
MAFDPQNIIGKTVNAYISRPGPGKTRIFMMMFTDGSCCEFVSGKNNAFSRARRGVEGQAAGFIGPVTAPAQVAIQQMALSGF